MASHFYNTAVKEMCDGTVNISSDSLKLMLVSNSYSENKDHNTISDVSSAEISVTGYTGGFGGSGRKACSVSLQANTTDDRVDIELNGGASMTWTSLGAGVAISGAVLVKEITNDASSRIIAWLDVADTSTNGSDFTLTFNTLANGGNLRIAN